MPIVKTVKADNGIPVGYHKVRKLEFDVVNNTANVIVQSHTDEQASIDRLPIAWQWTIPVETNILFNATDISSAIESYLVSLGSKFESGELKVDGNISMEVLKQRKREEITRDRLAADADHFTYTYTDANGNSVSKDIRTADKDMTDLLVADARISKENGSMPSNWPGGWKALDNSYVPISTVNDWNIFFIAMYDAGISNFSHSQELKSQIDSATTAEEISVIKW